MTLLSAQALGADVVCASIRIEEGPALICLEVERLGAGDGLPAGGRDTDGYDLHCLYEGMLPRLLQEGAGASRVLRARFDAQRMILVPYCGELKLIGGVGRYAFAIGEPQRWNGVYQPSWHTLTRYVERATTFAVPSGATMIGALNAGVSITSGDGDIWLLDGSMKPVTPGMTGTPVPDRVRVFFSTFF